MYLKHIAKLCCLSVVGDGELNVSALKYAEEAAEGDLAVAFSAADIERTEARAVLTEPRICGVDKTLIYCIYGGIIAAVAAAARLLIAQGELPDYQKPVPYRELGGGVFVGANVKIGSDTRIDPWATIGDNVVIGDNCHIESGVYIGSGTVIGNGCVLYAGARVGTDSFMPYEENGETKCFCGVGRAILKDNVRIGCNAVVQRGALSDTVLQERVLIGPMAVVGHDVKIGRDTRVVGQSGIAGRAVLGSHVKIFGQSGVGECVHMGDRSALMARSGATKNVQKAKTISGNYGLEHKQELRSQAMLRRMIRE